jgi:hypothetical protein
VDPVSHTGQPLLTEQQWQASQYGRHAATEAAPEPAPVSDMAIPDDPRPQPFLRTAAEPSPYYTTLRAHADEMDAPVTEPMSAQDNLRPLGRVVRHDPRSLQYLVPESTATPTSIAWARKIPVLDQGNLGSCTGNAAVGVLGTEPFYDTLTPTEQGSLDENEAIKVYSLATQLDNFGGTYPPTDSGSSGLGAAQAAKQLGLISGYLHITSLAAAHTAIASGPFITGVNWYEGFDTPDANGVVTISGQVRGGHEFEVIGYDAAAGMWEAVNSWGTSYGLNGRMRFSDADFARLLSEQGDATVLVPLTQPAPIPTPVPPTPVPTPTPTPVPTPVPTPIPVGFPLQQWDAFAAHHRSEIKWQALKQAVDAWLAGG